MTFEDHGTPWSAVARNLDITVTKVGGYRGEATFHGGTIKIQNYLPMSASMKAVFRVDDGIVHFERMNLTTDGAESVITGDADMTRWPEQTYQVKSVVDFKRMRELFFAKDNYTLSGEGRFNGVFHLFKGGRSLTGAIRERRGRPQHRRPRLSVSRFEGAASRGCRIGSTSPIRRPAFTAARRS